MRLSRLEPTLGLSRRRVMASQHRTSHQGRELKSQQVATMLASAIASARGPAARLAARSVCTAVPMEEQMSVILKEKLSASKVEIEDTSGGA